MNHRAQILVSRPTAEGAPIALVGSRLLAELNEFQGVALSMLPPDVIVIASTDADVANLSAVIADKLLEPRFAGWSVGFRSSPAAPPQEVIE